MSRPPEPSGCATPTGGPGCVGREDLDVDPEAALAVRRWRLSERDREVAGLRARVAELELEAEASAAARSSAPPLRPGEVADEE